MQSGHLRNGWPSLVEYNNRMELFSKFDEQLKQRWDAALAGDPLASMPFMTYAWHSHWFTCFGADENPTILAGADSMVVPLSIKNNVAHFTGGEEIADYLDAVGDPGQKGRMWKDALPKLKELGATSLVLRNIPADSSTLTFFRNMPEAVINQEDTTPVISLPGTFDGYLASLDRKDRHELKRKMKKFEIQHQSIAFSVRGKNEIQMDTLINLMQKDPDKIAFLTPAMTGFFMGLPAVMPDTLVQFILTAGDKIIASTLAFRTPEALLLYNSGFDPQYPGAGWYIKVKSIGWAIDQHIASYNLLQGNERYKYDLGAADYPVYNISLPL